MKVIYITKDNLKATEHTTSLDEKSITLGSVIRRPLHNKVKFNDLENPATPSFEIREYVVTDITRVSISNKWVVHEVICKEQ